MKSDRISLVWGVFHFASGLTFLKNSNEQRCQVKRVWKQPAHESLKLCTTLGNASSADNWNNAFPKLAALSNYWYRSGNHVILFLPCSPSAVSRSTCQMAPRKAAVTAGSETTSPRAGPARPTRCPWASPRTSSTSRRPPTAARRATATRTPSPVSAQLRSSHLLNRCRSKSGAFRCSRWLLKVNIDFNAAKEALCF